MFTEDGAMLRDDGFATKFRWLGNDQIELYAEDTDKTAQFTILSLGEFELILKTGRSRAISRKALRSQRPDSSGTARKPESGPRNPPKTSRTWLSVWHPCWPLGDSPSYVGLRLSA